MYVHMHVCMYMNVGAWGGTAKHTHTHSHTPTRAGMAQITKYAIKFEQIKIIQIHLKILDPCTLVHTYRLDLMCRWGVSYPERDFYVLHLKKYIFFAPVTLQ